MTQDEIIEMAKEAGYKHPDAVGRCEDFAYFNLEAFAKLVAAKECEAVEERVVDLFTNMETPYLPDIVKAIRARGEA